MMSFRRVFCESHTLGSFVLCHGFLLAAFVVGCGAEPSTPVEEQAPLIDGDDDAYEINAETDLSGPGSPADTGEPFVQTANTAEPSWQILDLGEYTYWRDIKSFGIGLNARYILTGTNGVVCIYDGDSPQFMNLGVQEAINGAWAETEDSLFVVGDGGIVRQWDPAFKTWQKTASGLPPNPAVSYTAIHGNAANNIYIGADNGEVWKFNGTEWAEVWNDIGQSPAPDAVSDIWVDGDGVVYIASGTEIVWGQGLQWESFDLTRKAKALYGFGTGEIFTVADSSGGPGDYIFQFANDEWTGQPANSAAVLQGLNDIWGWNADNALAIGFKGTIVRYSPGVEDESLSAWGPVSAQEKDDYALFSPSGTPDEDKINPYILTLRSVHGISSEDILLAVEGIQSTDGQPPTANLIHYRRHPEL